MKNKKRIKHTQTDRQTDNDVQLLMMMNIVTKTKQKRISIFPFPFFCADCWQPLKQNETNDVRSIIT